MKSTREKEQHRRSAFRKRGFYRCYLIGRILEISLGGGQDRDERCLLRQLVSLMGRNLGNYGELVEFLVLSRCCIEREQKVHLCPFVFFVSSWDGLYICPLFVFLFMAWASAPVLARLVFGTGVAYTLERCLVWPGPGRTGLFYNILSRLGKHLERCGPGIHVMIRFKEVFGIMGGPRAWFCDAAVDCICVAIVNWVLALSGCDAAASAPRDENIRMFKHFEVSSVTCCDGAKKRVTGMTSYYVKQSSALTL